MGEDQLILVFIVLSILAFITSIALIVIFPSTRKKRHQKNEKDNTVHKKI